MMMKWRDDNSFAASTDIDGGIRAWSLKANVFPYKQILLKRQTSNV